MPRLAQPEAFGAVAAFNAHEFRQQFCEPIKWDILQGSDTTCQDSSETFP